MTKANAKTVVISTSGGSVATSRWIDHVPALLQSWYPGQQGGTALAKILFGEVNPSGRLPISWEKTLPDNPASKNYEERPGTTKVPYAEGLFLGYRHYDRTQTRPLFAFGFGLSYTDFRLSGLQLGGSHVSAEHPLKASFEVKNTGAVKGSSVVQVYVGSVAPAVERPVKELKAYVRVTLNPGESRLCTVDLNERAFSYWSPITHQWRLDPGRFIIYVGTSSQDTPLRQEARIQ